MKKIITVAIAVMLVFALCVPTFAAPTVDYVFRGTQDGTGDEYFYMFGRTDAAVNDLGVEIAGADFKAQTISFKENGTEEQLAALNSTNTFGFAVNNKDGVIGNTMTFKPYYIVGEDKTEGKLYFTKSTTTESAVVPMTAEEYTSQNYSGQYVTVSGNRVYALKGNSVQASAGAFSGAANMGYVQFSGFDESQGNYAARRNLLLQFPLTDDMLEAETISVRFGAMDFQSTGSYANFYNYDYKFEIYEATGLNNEWNIGTATDISDMKKELITSIDDTATTDGSSNKVDGNVARITGSYGQTSTYATGYTVTLGDKALTDYLKAKIANGEKVVNLSVEIRSIKDPATQAAVTAGTFLYVCSDWRSSGQTERPWNEPFMPALIWE